ncbi:hypothetical protein B7486_71720, partial [cyanobacterium TDX16]
SPSYTGTATLRFDQTDGFVVSQPGAGIARVDLAAATTSQAGGVSTGNQHWTGQKLATAGFGLETIGSPAAFTFYGAYLLANGSTEAPNLVFTSNGAAGGVMESGLLQFIHSSIGGVQLLAASWYHDYGAFTYSDPGCAIVANGFAWCDGTADPDMGITGTLAPGMTVKGGIIVTAGSGSFVSTSAANTFTNANTFHPSTDVVPVTLQGSAGQTA